MQIFILKLDLFVFMYLLSTMKLPKTLSMRAICDDAGVDYQRFARAYRGTATLKKQESREIFLAIQRHIKEVQKVKELDFVK